MESIIALSLVGAIFSFSYGAVYFIVALMLRSEFKNKRALYRSFTKNFSLRILLVYAMLSFVPYINVFLTLYVLCKTWIEFGKWEGLFRKKAP